MSNPFKKFDKFLHDLHIPNWLVWLLFGVLILRIPSFFEPFSYGDEMIYLALGEGVKQGKVLYRDIHDNKPPLLYLMAALAGNVFWFRAILAFWSFATIVLFWKLASFLFKGKEKLIKTATLIFAIFTTIPLFEGQIANSEVFMIGTTIAAFYVLLRKKLTNKSLLLGGLLFSISALFKIPAAFDVPVIIFYWLIINKKGRRGFVKIVKNTTLLSVGFLIPILTTLVWYYFRGAFREYLAAAFLQNVGYLSAFRPEATVDPFLVRNGPLLTRGLLVLTGVGVIAAFRKKLSKQFIFLSVWVLFTLFAVTLSERPYPHYLIQSVPPVSILMAMFFALKNKEQVLAIFPLTIAFFVPFYFKFWRYPVYSYYENFAKFATKQTSREEYMQTFGGHILRNYKLAETINNSTKRSDPIFVWGENSSMVYALSRRLPPIKYVAQYHISDFSTNEEVLNNLMANPPEIIIVLPKAPILNGIVPYLRENYIQLENIEGAEVWSFISPQIPS